MNLFDPFLPWWVGAPVLAATTVGFAWSMGRPLGISGSWARVINFRAEAAARVAEAPFDNDAAALEQALLAATAEEFGDKVCAQPAPSSPASGSATAADSGPPSPELAAASQDRLEPLRPRAPVAVHLTFLAAIVLGGFLSAASSGTFALRDLGADFRALVGAGFSSWVCVLVGGLLVGAGTRMAGGCSTGHGLSGCSRLQPGSLLAMMSFFGVAVVMAFLLELRRF